jgi:hypothetical protein
MLLSFGCGQQQIGNNKKCTDAAVRRRAHRPIEHIQGFTWSHWMPPSGECLRQTASAAAIVGQFLETTLNTNKTQLLPATTVHLDC